MGTAHCYSFYQKKIRGTFLQGRIFFLSRKNLPYSLCYSLKLYRIVHIKNN